MKYLVSWSGGLDSTYLVYKLLKEGHSVTAAYCEIGNNTTKTRREKNAIKKLQGMLSPLGPLHIPYGTRVTADMDSLCAFEQVPLLLLSVLYAGANAERVALAYTLNDDAIAFLPEIKTIYDSYQAISKESTWPEMVFPLYRTSKTEILKSLPVEFINEVTFCESAEAEDNCGRCSPCRRWKMLEESGAVPKEAKRFLES